MQFLHNKPRFTFSNDTIWYDLNEMLETLFFPFFSQYQIFIAMDYEKKLQSYDIIKHKLEKNIHQTDGLFHISATLIYQFQMKITEQHWCNEFDLLLPIIFTFFPTCHFKRIYYKKNVDYFINWIEHKWTNWSEGEYSLNTGFAKKMGIFSFYVRI